MDRLSTVYHPHCLVEPTSFPANIFKLCNWQWSLSTCWPAGSRGWEERKERTMVLKRSINQSIKKGKCMAPASSSVRSIKSGSKSHKILYYHYYFDGTSIRHLSILNDRSAASKFILLSCKRQRELLVYLLSPMPRQSWCPHGCTLGSHTWMASSRTGTYYRPAVFGMSLRASPSPLGWWWKLKGQKRRGRLC